MSEVLITGVGLLFLVCFPRPGFCVPSTPLTPAVLAAQRIPSNSYGKFMYFVSALSDLGLSLDKLAYCNLAGIVPPGAVALGFESKFAIGSVGFTSSFTGPLSLPGFNS